MKLHMVFICSLQKREMVFVTFACTGKNAQKNGIVWNILMDGRILV
uniref:Uncharacterized protein n=1 Tax=Arundo donax TaxID=35708 RepID=A0A0A9ABC8_ARUDO